MSNILIVDGAHFMRNMLKDILVKGGHTVVGEAENGLIALEKVKILKPDIITMDITMPVIQSIEAVKRIIATDPKARIIMCSAMGQRNVVIEAIQAGAIEFIIKPFHDERILTSIQKALEV
ncbi:response regulator [Paenibacillus sp. CMAA1364]